jgi:hypothetical protein
MQSQAPADRVMVQIGVGASNGWASEPISKPLSRFLKSGRAGAVARRQPRGPQDGALHRAWCVGWCWALMAALFAVG